jgi:hypothetical protein
MPKYARDKSLAKIVATPPGKDFTYLWPLKVKPTGIPYVSIFFIESLTLLEKGFIFIKIKI